MKCRFMTGRSKNSPARKANLQRTQFRHGLGKREAPCARPEWPLGSFSLSKQTRHSRGLLVNQSQRSGLGEDCPVCRGLLDTIRRRKAKCARNRDYGEHWPTISVCVVYEFEEAIVTHLFIQRAIQQMARDLP